MPRSLHVTFRGVKKPGLGVKNLEQAGCPKASCLTFLGFNLLIYYITEIEKFGKAHSKLRSSVTFHNSDILPASCRKKPCVFPASHNPVSRTPFKRKPWDLTGTSSGSGPSNKSVPLGRRTNHLPFLPLKLGCRSHVTLLEPGCISTLSLGLFSKKHAPAIYCR